MTRGEKLRETMIKKYGSLELWKAHLKEIASVGGKNGTGHTWAHGKADPAESGRKGGTISRKPRKIGIIE